MLFNLLYYFLQKNVSSTKSLKEYKNIRLDYLDFFDVIFFFGAMYREGCFCVCIFSRFRFCNHNYKILQNRVIKNK